MNINLDISGSKDVIYVDEQDTSTSIVFYIKDNGSAVNLTGLTLSFVLHRTSYIVAPLTITSASSGIATLTLTSAMTASPGTLAFEVVGMESDDTPEFDISSYMVVQKVYSGSDGQNDPDEENPGIDVLYGEEAPDDETDGEDKDFYLKEAGDVIYGDDYTAHSTEAHPITLDSFTTIDRNEFEFVISGKPWNDGTGETLKFPYHNMIDGETYTISFDLQESGNLTWYSEPAYDYVRLGEGTEEVLIELQKNKNKNHYEAEFVYSEGDTLDFLFFAITDNLNFTATITDLTIQGEFVGDKIIDIYNKRLGKWIKYTPTEMKGATSTADGESGSVPAPTIADREKYLRGDGTWQDAQGASAVSDLTDVELTNIADKEILEWDAVAEKWKNVANSGGGGGSALILDAQIYSEEERQIGVWIDNKPLYAKSVSTGGSAPSDTALIQRIVQTGYDTLLYTKLSDRAGSGGYQAYGFSPIIYSEEEREVGVWIDNKPLYAKSFKQRLSGSSAHIDVTSLNIADGWVYDGFYDIGVTNLGLNENLASNSYTWTHLNNELNPPYIECYCVGFNNSTIYVTILYTKTTDVAGSGKYNTLGVPTQHYTTDEQVIGTWVDGKPLYERSFFVDSPTVNTTTIIQDASFSNIKYVVKTQGVYQRATSGYIVFDTIGSYENSNYSSFCRVVKASPNASEVGFAYYIKIATGNTISNLCMTIQYTKTTD